MKWTKIFNSLSKKRKKTTQFKNDYAYRVIIYKSQDGKTQELIWNGTNLIPPLYVMQGELKLLRDKYGKDRLPHYTPSPGERYFSYMCSTKYIQTRTPMLQWYWQQNFNEVQTYYSSYEEYFAIGCKGMEKPRIELLIQD